MNKFKIGERYKVNCDCYEKGNIIEITKICNGGVCIYQTVKGVFHQTIKGIRLGGHYFSCNSDFAKSLVSVTNCSKKIVITSDGKTTTAKLYDGKQLLKSAEAKCSTDDTFDFETGATIASMRLTMTNDDISEPVLSCLTDILEIPSPSKMISAAPEIKAGDFVRIKNSNGIALMDGTIARVHSIFSGRTFAPYELMGIGWIGDCERACAQRKQLEKVDFNLEDFKAGKIIIEVNEKNIMECMKLLQRLGLNWVNKITDFNPYNSAISYSKYDMYLRYECGIHYGIYDENSAFIKGFKIFKW